MNALVLSGGGMYGAYQAGAWKVLADVFQPDLIVGASIGAVNGWAIAGGCDPDKLIERWLSLEAAAHYRWKLPASIFGGVLDSAPLNKILRETYDSFQPRIDFALVLTDLLKLQPRIFRGPEITSERLIATTAIPGIFDQVRIDGRLYSDGGLLCAVPLWAAAELGATRAVVIDLLPESMGALASSFVRSVRHLSSFRATVPASVEVFTVTPPKLLGPVSTSIYWTRDNARAWIEAGERDAQALIGQPHFSLSKISHSEPRP